MPLTITSDLITSDRTAHTARPFPGHPHVWQVTWLPGQADQPERRRHRHDARRRRCP